MLTYSEENLESRWYREHSHRLHKQRLHEIKERSSNISKSPVRFFSVSRRRPNNDAIKKRELNRENMILYEKLTQISGRKTNQFIDKTPKSLNSARRKKEAERIIQNNMDMVKRLTEKESFVSAKRHKEQYSVMERYKNSISKAGLHDRLKKITFGEIKLPPISTESLSVMEKNRTMIPKRGTSNTEKYSEGLFSFTSSLQLESNTPVLRKQLKITKVIIENKDQEKIPKIVEEDKNKTSETKKNESENEYDDSFDETSVKNLEEKLKGSNSYDDDQKSLVSKGSSSKISVVNDSIEKPQDEVIINVSMLIEKSSTPNSEHLNLDLSITENLS
ncbi:hypothetical protein SteCoe_15767 [Stentor coeruleus]|uniref:Uncharacterized protein n=1 Tax=Stentor coeruleus TaxID=5963 RepID=A0A1R2C2V1_9CILI|nr:hypothetical protein SteCoe_15767 [Stentor coeruleus]